MDIYCTRCGEPWDVDYVRHEAPEGFDRNGTIIKSCPVCHGKPVELSTEEARRLEVIREIAGWFGNDLDAFAGELEDFFSYWGDDLD